jgi:tRNA C32,U32 (ribose-2'-O)-methylase TrmJ
MAYAVSARHRNLGPPALPARQAPRGHPRGPATGEVALLFGNETAGLSNAEVQRCRRAVFIPPIRTTPRSTSLRRCSCCATNCGWLPSTASRRW